MTRTVMVVCLISVASGALVWPSDAQDGRTLQSVRLNRSSGTALGVVWDSEKGQEWYRLKDGETRKRLTHEPATSLLAVWQMAVSPTDRYLAVISGGEGHPIADVFVLSDVLDGGTGKAAGAVAPTLALDPYPGTVSLGVWRQDELLELDSDMPLDKLDKITRRVPAASADGQEPVMPCDHQHRFEWDLRTDTIRRTARGPECEPGRDTVWASAVSEHGGTLRTFVASVRGVPSGWSGKRHIVHRTSASLASWTLDAVIDLGRRGIDAFVHPRSNGGWRMWSRDEADHLACQRFSSVIVARISTVVAGTV